MTKVAELFRRYSLNNRALKSVFLVAFFLVAHSGYSQPAYPYKPSVYSDSNRMQKIQAVFPVIEKIYREYADKNHFPGIAFGLVVDGNLIYSGGYGLTDVAKKIPVSTRSLFRIASMTKSFTAMAILKLRDEGKLSLDEPAYKYIPEMKKLHYIASDAPPITIRNLLTHSAGFPEDNPWGDRQLEDSDADLLKLINDGISFSNVPGIAYEYSNLGFALLGHIITKVSGKSYEQYITENILKPLGMKDTKWEYSDVPAAQLAHGYRWQNQQWIEQPILHDGAYGAMGGLITSIEDFSKYVALHQSAWPPRNGEDAGPIKRSSIREMQHPWNISSFLPSYKFPDGRTCATVSAYCYGLGWMQDCEGRVIVGHSGGLPGFGSQWTILPEYGIGIIAFSNLTYAPFGTVNLQVLDTLIKLAGLTPMKLPGSDILIQRRNELVKIIPDWKNAEATGIFAVNFFADNPIDSLRKEAATIFSDAGEIIKVHDMQALNQLRGSFIIEAEKMNIEVMFTLTPENPPLIQEYHIKEVAKN
jgi:CubicO group peptidase (beta-lactamase class C family)